MAWITHSQLTSAPGSSAGFPTGVQKGETVELGVRLTVLLADAELHTQAMIHVYLHEQKGAADLPLAAWNFTIAHGLFAPPNASDATDVFLATAKDMVIPSQRSETFTVPISFQAPRAIGVHQLRAFVRFDPLLGPAEVLTPAKAINIVD